jgi:hypothetical protein
MNPLKLSIAVAVAGLFASAGTVAALQALPPYTYVFTATPNPSDPAVSDYDGSTITIQNDAVISWKLIDGDAYPLGSPLWTPADSYVFRPQDTTYNQITAYDETTWTGHFTIEYDYPTVGEQRSLGGNSDGSGFLEFDQLDPDGIWTEVSSAQMR